MKSELIKWTLGREMKSELKKWQLIQNTIYEDYPEDDESHIWYNLYWATVLIESKLEEFIRAPPNEKRIKKME